jgi:hypothetical protein
MSAVAVPVPTMPLESVEWRVQSPRLEGVTTTVTALADETSERLAKAMASENRDMMMFL